MATPQQRQQQQQQQPTQLSQQELGRKLLAACNVLYSPKSSKEGRSAADIWLNSFRCTKEAWMLCHSLLAAPTNVGEEVLYFAAQTLHRKIRADFEQLPASTHGELCQSIIQHIGNFSSGPKNVLTKLCLALSALAVRTHSTDIWLRSSSNNQRDVIGKLIDTFSGNANASICLLEVLYVILAEAEDERLEIDNLERDSFDHSCRGSSQYVFQYFNHLLHNSGQNDKIHKGIFRCLTAWIAKPYISSMPRLSGIELLAASEPLIKASFATLNTKHLFDVGVDCCLELMRTYWDSMITENMPVISLVIPAVMNQIGRLQEAIAKDDTETIVGLTRLFTEVGESYMELIIGEKEMNQIVLLQALLACMAYRDETDNISLKTLRFWRCLSRMLLERNCKKRMSEFNPIFLKVAETCIGRCVLTKEKVMAPLRNKVDEKDGIRMSLDRLDDRIEYGLCIKEACINMLGYETIMKLVWPRLRMAVEKLISLTSQGTGTTNDALVDAWCVYEGYLFAAISAMNHRESEQYPQLQELGEMISCITMVANGNLPGGGGNNNSNNAFNSLTNSAIRQHMTWMIQRTTISLVFDECYPKTSCMSVWMERHSQLMQPFIQLTIQHLIPTTMTNTLYINIPMLAGNSLLNMCTYCPRNIDINMLRQFYEYIHSQSSNSNGSINTKLRMIIIEALCRVINVQQDKNSGIQFVLLPLAKDLHASTNGQLDVIKVTSLLDAIHVVVRNLRMDHITSTPHPIVAAIIQMWPMFQLVAGHIVQISEVKEMHELMLEKLCRVYKYVLRNTDSSAVQLLPPMLQQMTTLYGQHPLSPALNMVSFYLFLHFSFFYYEITNFLLISFSNSYEYALKILHR